MSAPRLLRVAVTRNEGPDGALARALRRWGLAPVNCDVLTFAPAPDPEALRRAAERVERYDWLIAASARAVAALQDARGGAPLPSDLRCAAVGLQTAAALEQAGASPPMVTGTAGSGTLLAALRTADDWAGRSVLIPRAAEGGREIAEALRALGASVDEVAAYRTVVCPPDEVAARWRRAAPDAAVVASPSAARALVAGVGAETVVRLRGVVAIGGTTADALRAHGIEPWVPSRPDFEAAAELCARRLALSLTEISS